MTALYVLSQEYRAAADALADLDMDEQTVADTLESMSGELEAKAMNVAFVARNLEATAAAIHEAEQAMAARRKALEKRADGLRAYLQANMEMAQISKIEGPQLRIALRANPPAVDVFDAAQIPAEYMRVPDPPPPAPDKAAIKAALQEGRDVPGARITRRQRVEIRA